MNLSYFFYKLGLLSPLPSGENEVSQTPHSSSFLFRDLGIVPNAPVIMRPVSTGLSLSLLSSIRRSWYCIYLFLALSALLLSPMVLQHLEWYFIVCLVD